MAGYAITDKDSTRMVLHNQCHVFILLYLICTLDFTYPKTMENQSSESPWKIDTGAGLFIASFILTSQSLSIEDKFTASKILQYLIIENEGRESSALFGELEIALDIPENDIIRCIEILQGMQLITCFRDRYNIGGDMTMYVGWWTRDAYFKEFNKTVNGASDND